MEMARTSLTVCSCHVTQFEHIRLVPGNMVMAPTDMSGKTPSRGSGYMGLRGNMHF